jgi:uncharacterized membrane protein YkvA (DUF1232 family)
MGIMQVIGIFIICGTVLLLALMVLVAIPQSRLRDILLQVVGWLFAGSCAAYVVSPVDAAPELIFGPFGLLDDLIAIILGVMSAMAAWSARRNAKVERNTPTVHRSTLQDSSSRLSVETRVAGSEKRLSNVNGTEQRPRLQHLR